MKKVIYALHGFLGLPTDWELVRKIIHEEKPDWIFVEVDLFHQKEFSTDLSYEQWVAAFYKWLKNFEDENLKNQNIQRTLVGYSLGGRLALHLLQENPEYWAGSVFISTNPGLINESEKLQRLENDRQWAKKFLNQNFSLTLKEWNNQPVFQSGFEPERKEVNYNKNLLVSALLNWSLALQKDFRILMDLWNVRQIWVAGEKDKKFSQILKTLPECQDIQRWEVEGASHRLIFEAPEEIAHFIIRVSMPPIPIQTVGQ